MAEFILDFLLSGLGDLFSAFFAPIGKDHKRDTDQHDQSTLTSEW